MNQSAPMAGPTSYAASFLGTARGSDVWTPAEAKDYFNRATPAMPAARKFYTNKLAQTLKNYGILDRLDGLCLASPDGNYAMLNLARSAYDLVKSGTTVLDADGAYQSQSSSYLRTGWRASDVGARGSQDDFHVGVWSETDATSENNDAWAGGPGVVSLFIRRDATNDYINARINDASPTAAYGSAAVTSGLGHFVAQRVGTARSGYQNGALKSSDTGASTGLPTDELYFLGRPGNNFSPRKYLALHWGKSLSDAQHAILTQALTDFLNETWVVTPVDSVVRNMMPPYTQLEQNTFNTQLDHTVSWQGVGSFQQANTNLFKFDLRKGNRASFDSTLVDRTEMEGFNTVFPYGTTIWVSFSQRLWKGLRTQAAWGIIGQFHAVDNVAEPGRSPPFAMQLEPNDVLKILSRYDDSLVTVPNVSVQTTTHYTDVMPRGTWVNWVWQLDFELTTNGVVKVWRDGSLVVDYAGRVGFNDPEVGRGNYFKYGEYRATSEIRQPIEYANVEWGTADLSARIASPLVIPS